jgi:hypothetical protein
MLPSPPFCVSDSLHHASLELERVLSAYFDGANKDEDVMERSAVAAIRRGWQIITVSRREKRPDAHAKYMIALVIHSLFERAIEKVRKLNEADRDAMVILSFAFTQLMFNEEREPITVESFRAGAKMGEALTAIKKPLARFEPSLN